MALPRNQIFEEYVASIKTKSEDLLKNVIPQKVVELNKLLEQSDHWKDLQTNAIAEAENLAIPRPRGAESGQGDGPEPTQGEVACNKVLVSMIATVKPYMINLQEHANHLKMWLQFLIPKVEDGNNFGVEIQEFCLQELTMIAEIASLFFKTIERYHEQRADALKKVTKYPFIEDYRRAIKELDEKEGFWLHIVLVEIRNHYAQMYDFYQKNEDRILAPRGNGNHLDAMY